MIITEKAIINGIDYKYTYSTDGYMIIQDETGYKYDVAYDPMDTDRVYTETDELIEDEYAI